ncbi:MAG: hypothetical protein ACPGVP_15115 [Thiolinea sp.]
MATNKLVFFAVIAGLGLSACSNTPKKTETASIPEAGELRSHHANHSGIRSAQPLTPQGNVQTVAQALDLRYHNQQHVQTAVPRAYQPRQPIRQQHVSFRTPRKPQISSYLPRQQQQRMQSGNHMPSLSQAELRAIGQQIFVNEGGGNMNRLVHWNVGEDFAAMGIGHFTWYPAGRRQRFGNTFPGLLDFMASRGVQLPGWLQQARHTGSPWRSRSDFLRNRNSSQVKELQRLLYNTREIQAEYIVNRARRAMPRLVKASSGNMQQHVARNLNAVANTPGGWYALIDYVNFKGEGLGKGGYKGKSWGLRQVLEEMRPSQPGRQALNEFADAAMRVLQRRVRNSDPRRNEKRWLRGWQNRVNTYRNPVV